MQDQHETLLRAFRPPSMGTLYPTYIPYTVYQIYIYISRNIHRICPAACNFGNKAVLSNHFPLIGRFASCFNAKVDLRIYITKTIPKQIGLTGLQGHASCECGRGVKYHFGLSVSFRYCADFLIAICTDFSWAHGGLLCTCLPPSI